MNLLLWALQIILAVKFVSVGYTHGVRPDPTKMQRGMQRFGAAMRPLLIAIAVCMFLGAVAPDPPCGDRGRDLVDAVVGGAAGAADAGGHRVSRRLP